MEQSNIPGAKMKQPETGMKHRFLLLFGTILIVSIAIMGNIRATTYECDSCSSCNYEVENNVQTGDMLLLNTSITADTNDCILIESPSNFVIDCNGYYIDGDGIYGNAIRTNGVHNITFNNCIIKGYNTGDQAISIGNVADYGFVVDNLTAFDNDGDCVVSVDYGDLVLKNSVITSDSGYSGLCSGGSGNTTLYNNILNNAYLDYGGVVFLYNNYLNISFLTFDDNISLNTTKTLGTNIIGGLYLGGNYWTNSEGTGYSDICSNENNDSFCDVSYFIESTVNNTDYLPLTLNFPTPTTIQVTINQPQNISYYEGNLAYNATTNITANSICLSTDGNLTYPICSYNVSMLYGTINITPGFYNWTFRANNSNTVYDTVFFTINETPEEETPGPISNETIIFQIDPNADTTITKYLCSDNNTLKIESNIQYCVSGTGNFTPNCYYINKTKYQNCAYGCYPGVVENGDYCSPPDYILWGFGLIVFFVAIFLINRYYRGR